MQYALAAAAVLAALKKPDEEAFSLSLQLKRELQRDAGQLTLIGSPG
jgi:hypothetical protein